LLERELPARSRFTEDERLICAACSRAHDLAAAVGDACWRAPGATREVTLLQCLRDARRSYDERLEREQATRGAEDDQRARLRADPVALREHLRQRTRLGRYELLERFGNPNAQAIELLLHADGILAHSERAALRALAGEDPLHPRVGEQPIVDSVSGALTQLAEHYRDVQRARAGELAAAHGEGPALRGALCELGGGGLLQAAAFAELERRAAGDKRASVLQARWREAYTDRREREARRLARQKGLAARLLAVDAFLEQADRLWLRVCPSCREIVYPQPEEQLDEVGLVPAGRACPLCARRDLDSWQPAPTAGGSPTADHAGQA